jgi:hypothetical protein
MKKGREVKVLTGREGRIAKSSCFTECEANEDVAFGSFQSFALEDAMTTPYVQ